MSMKKHIFIISVMIILSLAIILFSVSTKYRNPLPSSKMFRTSSIHVKETHPSTRSSEPHFPVAVAENTEVETVDENESNEIIPEAVEFPSAKVNLSNDNASLIDDANSQAQNETEAVAPEKVIMNDDNNTLTQSERLERIIREYADPTTPPERRRELLELDEVMTRPVRALSISGIRTSGACVHQTQ